MANNPYVNKVQLADGTSLIDISDTTATADKILQGYTAYSASGQKLTGTATGGGGGSVTQDQDGYIVLPSTGGGSGITVEALSVTQNGTYTAQTGHAYSPVTVNVSGSPSATQHTIYFEFTDSTDATINAWYDSSFISDAIRATEPTTYGQKTVDSASLDGVEWYHRSTAQWETLLDVNTCHVNAGTPYGNIWISELGDVSIAVGSVWRITIDGDAYIMTATANGIYGSPYNTILGNPLYLNGSDDGSDVPLCLEQNPWGGWSGGTATSITTDVDHALKVERQITV